MENVYEKLYTNMKNNFTVAAKDDMHEYNLGEYMLMKANQKSSKSNLPSSANASNVHAVSAFFRYINDKLVVKKPPVKDKIIKSFPFRTSAAALLSAVLACTLVFSFGSLSVRNASKNLPTTVNVGESIDKTDTPANYIK